jgi:hypothetical protein
MARAFRITGLRITAFIASLGLVLTLVALRVGATTEQPSVAPAWGGGSGLIQQELTGVAYVSPTNAWAVGMATLRAGDETLIEHWDGSRWTVTPSPRPVSGGMLWGVDAASANDVWAVGGEVTPRIDHFDGSGWTVASAPDPSGGGSLLSVSSSAANDVWAVGVAGANTLIEHWDGASWTIIPSPTPSGYYTYLNGVAAISATDAWAVGFTWTLSDGPQATIEHWDGSNWTLVTAPSSDTELNAVSASSGTDVWAVGEAAASSGNPSALVEHWDGTAWSVEPVPSGQGPLSGVDAISTSNVWAVGPTGTAGGTIADHFDGTTWSRVPSPKPIGGGQLIAVSGPGGDVWAVGGDYFSKMESWQPLVEHFDGTSWAISPSFRPDAMVRTLDSGNWVGDSVFDAGGQTLRLRGAPGGRVTVVIGVRNYGYSADAFLVRGPGGSPSISIAYLASLSGTMSITPRVISGTYSTPPTSPGHVAMLRMVITPSWSSVPGTSKTYAIKVVSQGDPTRWDEVRVRLIVT